jgi:gliding motility-associated-like protein
LGVINGGTTRERVIIVATEDNEKIFINGLLAKTLNKGQTFAQYLSYTYTHIRSEKGGIYVMQVSGVKSEMGAAILPSISGCTGSFEVAFVRSADCNDASGEFYLNIMVRKGAEGHFLVNGSPNSDFSAAKFVSVPGSPEWMAMRTSDLLTSTIRIGTNVITNTKDLFHLGLLAYNGGGTGTNYGFFSNFNEFTTDVINTVNGLDTLYACYDVPVTFMSTSGMSELNSTGLSYRWNTGDTTAFISVIPKKDAVFYVTVTLNNSCGLTATDSTKMTVNPEIFAKAYASDSLVCRHEPVEMYAEGSIKYKWSTGATTQYLSVKPAVPTTYFVSVIDQANCFDVDSVVIDIKPLPLTKASANQYICTNESTMLNVTGEGIAFHWSNGATTNSTIVKPFENSKYYITTTGVNGCFNKDSVSVFLWQLPIAYVNNKDTVLACADSVVMLHSYNSSSYKYKWNTGATTSTIYATMQGFYEVTVSDNNNCINRGATYLKMLPLPEASAGTYNPICDADPPVTLTASGGMYYAWNTGATTRVITIKPPATTTFIVTVTDQNNCKKSSSTVIVVNKSPTPFIEGPDTVYMVDQQKFFSTKMVNGNVYLWNVSNALLTSGHGTNSINLNFNSVLPKPAIVEVHEIVASTGCIGQAMKSVVVVIPPRLTLNKKDILCFGEQNAEIFAHVDFGVAPISYAWSNMMESSYLTDLPVGDYSVTITDKYGYRDSGMLSIVQPDPLTIFSEKTDVLCSKGADGTAAVFVSGGIMPYYYQWNNGQKISSIDMLKTGDYSVTVNDANNCEIKTSLSINDPSPIIVNETTVNSYCPIIHDGEIEISISGGTPADSVNPYQILWNNYATTTKITKLEDGLYVVTVTDANGCIREHEVELNIRYEICLQVPTAFSPNADGINDYWMIPRLQELYPKARVYIFNRQGTLLYESNSRNQLWNGMYRNYMQPIDSYHYIIELHDEDARFITGQVTIVR